MNIYERSRASNWRRTKQIELLRRRLLRLLNNWSRSRSCCLRPFWGTRNFSFNVWIGVKLGKRALSLDVWLYCWLNNWLHYWSLNWIRLEKLWFLRHLLHWRLSHLWSLHKFWSWLHLRNLLLRNTLRNRLLNLWLSLREIWSLNILINRLITHLGYSTSHWIILRSRRLLLLLLFKSRRRSWYLNSVCLRSNLLNALFNKHLIFSWLGHLIYSSVDVIGKHVKFICFLIHIDDWIFYFLLVLNSLSKFTVSNVLIKVNLLNFEYVMFVLVKKASCLI